MKTTLKKLQTAFLYGCSTKIKAIGIFYLINYSVFVLIFLLILLCTGETQIGYNGMEFSTAIFVSIMGVLSFKEDFKALLQNGYTRGYMFLSTLLMFSAIAGAMALIDTAAGMLLRYLLPRYFSIFGLLYGYRHPFLNWMWLTALYLLCCSLFYLAVLFINKVGKTASLLTGVGLAGVFLTGAALVRFVLPPESVEKLTRAALHAMGFFDGGVIKPILPVLTFLAVGIAAEACAYAVLRRTELR